MYELGNQFKFDLTKSTANNSCVFKGNKYRITVLTERLVRLEYNEKGIFEDHPTALVWYRNFSKPNFTFEETESTINIKTNYFNLSYKKEKHFAGSKLSPMANLKISLTNTDRVWYYNHPEAKNYSINNSLENLKIKQKSLYSLDGFATIVDDSPIILEDGVFKKREDTEVDIYVFLYNNDFYYALNDYFMITGYPPLIPRYALGNWWKKADSYNDETLEKFIKKLKFNNIPISIITLCDWQSNNDYYFNNNFKNPIALVNLLKENNIKLGLSINYIDKFKKDTPLFLKLKNYLQVDKNGDIPFNLFDPRTIDAYLKLIISPLDQIGVNFYSIDNCKNLSNLIILKHYLYLNKNTMLNRPLISAYDSLVSSHRYPVLYSGLSTVSWDTLTKIAEFNIKASNLGLSFLNHDFGGSSGGIEDNELFTRFIQLGVFSPLLQLGSSGGKYYKREPWKWGLKTSIITSNYLNLRHRLIPYLYTEAYKYHKYGRPLIEPIYYRYKDMIDDSLYCHEYYFGSNFFISPILSKKDYIINRVIHKLFIPEGTWYGFITGKKYNGNKKYVGFYKDEEYPIFVRAGSIIPMSLNELNDTSIPRKLELQIFPGDNGAYSIYEDDGVSNSYLNGDYTITNVEYRYKKNAYTLTVLPVAGKTGILPKTRDYKLRFKNTKQDVNVVSYVNGTQVKNKYYKDDTDLIVEVNDVDTSSQLTLICKAQNIEIDALRIINEDIVSIISDLPIKTSVKVKIDKIMFSESLDLKKKRIEIRKLSRGKDYLEKKYIQLFLKLLEYINEV